MKATSFPGASRQSLAREVLCFVSVANFTTRSADGEASYRVNRDLRLSVQGPKTKHADHPSDVGEFSIILYPHTSIELQLFCRISYFGHENYLYRPLNANSNQPLEPLVAAV